VAVAQDFRLLSAFEALYSRHPYVHRASTHGDNMATELFEDLFVRSMARDPASRFVVRVNDATRVVDRRNKSYNVSARRGDGLLGEVMHGAPTASLPGFAVKRGPTVATEIGVEMKIVAKAMLKQIGRVCTDLNNQKNEFAAHTGSRPPISVAIVAVNFAPIYCGLEKKRKYITDGKTYRHPIQEAAEAKRRLETFVKPNYDFFIMLEYSATNMKPYPFSWVNPTGQVADYNAELSRLAVEYEARFGK
jgi:hypothetical protein